MNKTIHKKLTGHLAVLPVLGPGGEELFMGLTPELKMLREASKDLLSPRPEAIANLLKMAKDL